MFNFIFKTAEEQIKVHFPNVQIEERNYGHGRIPTRFEKKVKGQSNFFVIATAPWSYEIGAGVTKEQAWEDALKYVKCLRD